MEASEVESDEASISYLRTMASLLHESRMKESQLQSTNQEINKLEKEVDRLELERRWCFDDQNQRIIPTVEQKALHLSQEVAAHPEIREDIVKALRMKRIDLQCNLKELQQRCEVLKEQIKK